MGPGAIRSQGETGRRAAHRRPLEGGRVAKVLRMRVLHVVADWKWTGPAEPMLLLARAQRARGDEVALACPDAPAGESGLADHARAAGFGPAPVLERARGARPWRDRRDAVRLYERLRAGRFDVVHAWHTRDHVLCFRAARWLAGVPLVARSWGRAERIAGWPWDRWVPGRPHE